MLGGWGGVLIVARGDGVNGKEGICTIVEHCHGDLEHQGFCLEVQISQHDVSVSSSQHANGVLVNWVAQRAGADVHVLDATLVRHGNGDQTKRFGGIGGFDGNTFTIVIVQDKMSGFCGFMLTDEDDATDGGFGGVCYIITFCAIFLCCESE
jgi:hypothetical protein